MRLINVEALLERERVMDKGERVDRRTKVLEFADDEATSYAILSHRWIGQEVDYDEVVELAKMDADQQNEIRRRPGYQKILDSCRQAKDDGFKWLWVDTCCIDKRSSAELSEAINSMYRWYANSLVCYAYLHDTPGTFSTARDDRRYPNSNGWPEWFSRGWTLQEMIAPSNVQFFNKDWQCIGDKRTLSNTLSRITGVPSYILTDGLSSNRPCVAQIMSWAAFRTTTRVEDRAYSLMGLLDVNMPMLYGEGKKAFHRLQLEIIRTSNDQSIFAWDPYAKIRRTGSILADDPNLFQDCDEMELMDSDEFIEYFKLRIPNDKLDLIREDRFSTFPITNRGIQIWLPLCPLVGSRSVFEALLPCRCRPSDPPVPINLALWNSNYYRISMPLYAGLPTQDTLQFCELYLRYQDTLLPRDTIFEVDDSAIIEKGFVYRGAYPPEITGTAITLTSILSLCVKFYSDSQNVCCFAVGFGQCLGQDWIHFSAGDGLPHYSGYSWKCHVEKEYEEMAVRGPEHARSMAEARSRSERYGRVCITRTCLPKSAWALQTSCAVWERARIGVRFEIFRDLGFSTTTQRWTGLDIDRINDPNRDMRGLMLQYLCGRNYAVLVDGVPVEFLRAPHDGIKLGDYGRLTAEGFTYEGNIFTEPGSSNADINPRQHRISGKFMYHTSTDRVLVRPSSHGSFGSTVNLYKPLGLSLPSNNFFTSLLASLSTRLINKFLVIRVIQSATDDSGITTPFYALAKPFVWYQDDDDDSTAPPPPKSKPASEYVTALYDFTAQGDGDLSFKAGDRIEIVTKAGDWWIGRLNGAQGDVPSNFVR